MLLVIDSRRLILGATLLAAVAGGVIWRVRDGDSIVRTIDVSAVLMAVDAQAGTIVVAGNGDTGGRITVLDARSGAILHAIATKGGVSLGVEFVPSSLLALDEPAHRAYVTTPGYGTGATSKGLLTVVDTQRVTLVRTVTLALPPVAMAVDRRAGRIFLVDAVNATISLDRNRSSVTMLDARSGAIVREVLADQGVENVAVVERTGRAFVASQRVDKKTGTPLGPGIVSTLDSASGRVVNTVAVGQNPYQVVVDERSSHVFSVSTSEQAPYIGRVTMLDAHTGAVLHTTAIGSIPMMTLVDRAGGRLFMLNVGDGPGLGSVSVLDTRSGAHVQIIAMRDTPVSMDLNARLNRLFVVVEDYSNQTCANGPNHLLIIDLAHHGRVLRSVALAKGSGAIAVDERHGRVFVVTAGASDPMRACIPTENGAVSVLDARSGSLLRTIPVGVAPSVIVDEPSGHAFVLNAGGTMSVRVHDRWAWLPGWLRQRLPFAAPSPAVKVVTVPTSLTMLDTTHIP